MTSGALFLAALIDDYDSCDVESQNWQHLGQSQLHIDELEISD